MKKDELLLLIILNYSGISSEEDDETLQNLLITSAYARELFEEFKTRIAEHEDYLQSLNEDRALELVRKILADESGTDLPE